MNSTIDVSSGSVERSQPNTAKLQLSSALPFWAYGVFSYLTGVAGLAYLIFALAGVVPLGSLTLGLSSELAIVPVNILLLLLFGLQHSIMARPNFKKAFRTLLPASLERATFVLASGIALSITVAGWQPVQGIAWQTEGALRIITWVGFIFGWAYLFLATFALNHFDLFGLRQIWFEVKAIPYRDITFKEQWMYRYSRHPIMLGALIGMWSVPTMTWTQLSLVCGLSVYIFVGLWFEERDLIRQWGITYKQYKKRVRLLF